MPASDRTVAHTPLLVSSCPTVGPTSSVPTTLNVPMLPFWSASTTASFCLLSSVPDSPLSCGVRTITWFDAGVPKACTCTFWPPP